MPDLAMDNPYKVESDLTENKKLEYVEKQHIFKVLKEESDNKSAAARILDISRKTLECKVPLWENV